MATHPRQRLKTRWNAHAGERLVTVKRNAMQEHEFQRAVQHRLEVLHDNAGAIVSRGSHTSATDPHVSAARIHSETQQRRKIQEEKLRRFQDNVRKRVQEQYRIKAATVQAMTCLAVEAEQTVLDDTDYTDVIERNAKTVHIGSSNRAHLEAASSNTYSLRDLHGNIYNARQRARHLMASRKYIDDDSVSMPGRAWQPTLSSMEDRETDNTGSQDDQHHEALPSSAASSDNLDYTCKPAQMATVCPAQLSCHQIRVYAGHKRMRPVTTKFHLASTIVMPTSRCPMISALQQA
eukprot:TRINITY_DN10046_c0_g1_i1.p1 TRINITY_DN10046_c0_g1~~TRINITY_DN10046_c0_g1_i1.p1  ORF type:complete len:292 (+),score=26.27 TRINITY_DN10046_c0_g1_i1:1-876(+)